MVLFRLGRSADVPSGSPFTYVTLVCDRIASRPSSLILDGLASPFLS